MDVSGHRFRPAVLAALLGTIFLAADCRSSSQSPKTSPKQEPAASPVAILDSTALEARITVSTAQVAPGVTGLLIPVTQVRNPRLTAVQVHVSLAIGAGDKRRVTQLGSFSLFPADRPGTFTIPFERVGLVRAADGEPPPDTFVIVLRLEPIVAQESMNEVRLEIGPLHWTS